MARTVLPGPPFPQGATWDGTGTNFAIFSENAEGAELCLFDKPGSKDCDRIRLTETTVLVWRCFLPGVQPGQISGYRVYAPHAPPLRPPIHPTKLLIYL